jgi:pyruvate-ferredoxin/flavodoxin oxidoreductase
VQSESRFAMLWNADPDRAEELLARAEEDVKERFFRYQQLAAMEWVEAEEETEEGEQ